MLEGKSRAHWTVRSGEHTHTFTGEEVYFNEKILVLGKGKNDPGASELTLESGEHRFPFSFLLPSVLLPFSFESPTGWIRYRVACNIDRPKKSNYNTERLFTLMGFPVDLNTLPQARVPSHQESTKTVCCLCCTQGPIVVKASTDKGAYVAGETIFVSVTIENNTRREIEGITFELLQHVTYYSDGGQSTLRKVVLIGCGSRDVVRVGQRPLLVPPIPPSGPQGCKIIIKINYMVEVEVGISRITRGIQVQLPVTIGTVPLCQPQRPDPSAVVSQLPSGSAGSPPPSSHQEA